MKHSNIYDNDSERGRFAAGLAGLPSSYTKSSYAIKSALHDCIYLIHYYIRKPNYTVTV